jgi:hypothetical protein
MDRLRRTLRYTGSVLQQRGSYQRMTGPQRAFVEQVHSREVVADDRGRDLIAALMDGIPSIARQPEEDVPTIA